jgi:DNA-binding protein H-NS
MTKTLSQIQKHIDTLTREAETMKRKEVDGVIVRIKEAIRIYGLTAKQLGLSGAGRPAGTGAPSGKAKKRASSSKSSAAVRYRDDAGNTWVGRGPRPIWLREALKSGKQLQDFAV